ncbi:mandelate racemase/muconate lactonizing enzyme family protein, partial [Mesorhizobium sp. M4B.F.Ca.ET.143.01.1.1]
MAKIEKIELRMVDLMPKVKRTDAIQSFVSQETPIVTVTDADGASGTG